MSQPGQPIPYPPSPVVGVVQEQIALEASLRELITLLGAEGQAPPALPVAGAGPVARLRQILETLLIRLPATGLASESQLGALKVRADLLGTEATLAAASAKLPATLGQKASAASLAAVLSTEQEAKIDLLAKAANQLPNNHQVTVSNPTANPETGLAKDTTLNALLARHPATALLDFDEAIYRADNSLVPLGSEMRFLITATDIYFAYAPDGTPTSTAVWVAVRTYLTAGSPVRKRKRTAVAWDQVTAGWT